MKQKKEFISLRNRLFRPQAGQSRSRGYRLRQAALERVQNKTLTLESIEKIYLTQGFRDLGMSSEVARELSPAFLRPLAVFLKLSRKECKLVDDEISKLRGIAAAGKRWPSKFWQIFSLSHLRKTIQKLNECYDEEMKLAQETILYLFGSKISDVSLKNPQVAIGIVGAQASQDYLATDKLRMKIRQLQEEFVAIDNELAQIEMSKKVLLSGLSPLLSDDDRPIGSWTQSTFFENEIFSTEHLIGKSIKEVLRIKRRLLHSGGPGRYAPRRRENTLYHLE